MRNYWGGAIYPALPFPPVPDSQKLILMAHQLWTVRRLGESELKVDSLPVALDLISRAEKKKFVPTYRPPPRFLSFRLPFFRLPDSDDKAWAKASEEERIAKKGACSHFLVCPSKSDI
jgi:hypothetical protein